MEVGIMLWNQTTLVLFMLSISQARGHAPADSPAPGFHQSLRRAEEAYSARDWKTATTLWAKVIADNPTSIEFCYKLGDSYYRSTDFESALATFQQCDLLTGRRSYWEALNLAKTYARLGNRPMALRWAREAFDRGLPDRAAFKDPAFDALRSGPELARLAGTAYVSSMTRNEGWRYDLEFLADEIRRKAYKVPRDFSREDLEREVRRISDAIPSLTDMQITVEFIKLLVKVGDGHSMLYAFKDNANIRKCIPLECFWFQEGLYVVQADKRFEDLLGARILAIEGRSPEVFFAGLDPLLSRDNPMTPKVMGTMRMRHTAILNALGLAVSPDRLDVRLMDRQGRTRDVTLPADSEFPSRRLWDGLPESWANLEDLLPAKPLYLRNRYKHYWFEFLSEENAVWFQYNRVLDDPTEPWEQFLTRLFDFIDKNPVERLVIDVRHNNGGNGELAIPLVHRLIRCDKINGRGRLFVVTGRKTFSAAGIAIGLLERHTAAIFAGEPAGTSPNFIGEESAFELPYSHLWGNVSDREHHYASAVDFRQWIPPLLYAPPTFNDFVTGRDAAWEAILAFAK